MEASNERQPESDPVVADLADLGQLAAELLCDDTSWIHRRKETIRVLDESTIRRQVSVDFEIPDQAPVWRVGAGSKVYLLPLLLLPKAPQQLMDFDLRDEAGKALSLPTREENGEVSAAALTAAASRVVLVTEELDRYLAYVAKAEARGAAIAATTLLDSAAEEPPEPGIPPLPEAADREELRSDQDFPWLIDRLATSSVVSVGISEAPTPRRIVKLQYSDPVKLAGVGSGELRLGWRGYQVFLDLYFIGAQTFHVEIEAPAGLELVDSGLAARTPTGIDVSRESGYRNRAHLYLRDATKLRDGLAWFKLRARRDGFVDGATIAAGLTAVVLSLGVLLASCVTERASTAPTLLLLIPGVVASYVFQRADHGLTRQMLKYARRLVAVSALLAYVAAARLVVVPAGPDHPTAVELRSVWIPTAIGAWAIFLALLRARFGPRPS